MKEDLPDGDGAAGALPAHLGALVEKRLRKLEENRDFARSSEPAEAVHAVRVSSRRLRAFVDVFESLMDRAVYEAAKKPLRKVTRAAGALRDLDVQTGLLERRIGLAASDAERAAIEHTLERLADARDEEARRTRKKLSSVEGPELRTAVYTALGEVIARLPRARAGSSNLARELLTGFVDAASSDAVACESDDAEALHALRIRTKRLRYALELFEPLLGEGYNDVYARVEGLQELLGAHHDLVVLEDVLRRRRGQVERRGRMTIAAGLAALEASIRDERAALFGAYRTAPFDAGAMRAAIDRALSSVAE